MIILSVFIGFVVCLFWIAWFMGKKAQTSDSYFVAGGQIHWFINGIALTGGYLSAASFLGISGMIAFKGFDGYLYSIGFLSGWVVALFVVAEPLRRLGKYTFADAIESRFKSRAIHLAAGISTLVICICYLVPQMVGAGVLIEPLLGISHHWGVILVGIAVILVVAGAGMSSTTYVQFVNGGMLFLFSAILTAAVLYRGLETAPIDMNARGKAIEQYTFRTLAFDPARSWEENLGGTPYEFVDRVRVEGEIPQTWVLLTEWIALDKDANDHATYHLFRRGQRSPAIRDPEGAIADLMRDLPGGPPMGGIVIQDRRVVEKNGHPYVGLEGWWGLEELPDGTALLHETQDITRNPAGDMFVNGLPAGGDNLLILMGGISRFGSRTGHDGKQGPMGPLRFLSVFADPETEVDLPRSTTIRHGDRTVTLYFHKPVTGNEFMRPGGHFKIAQGSPWGRLDFISLMIALFFGTAALPHVLIRYYTVRSSLAARRSTIVAITTIGLFYILTLYMGLGAIANGVLNPQSDNMSAPLLARSFGGLLFAIITGLSFTTVLATSSGLIVAASGAVANDLMDRTFRQTHGEKAKVLTAKITAISVGGISMILGILFRDVNVSFLVGLAFAVAASANFPSIMTVLFWKGATAAGIVSSILVGTISSLGIILVGPDMFEVYGLSRADAWVPLGQPAIVAIPLSFLTLIVVSLLTRKGRPEASRAITDTGT